jgi:hypothetical protein
VLSTVCTYGGILLAAAAALVACKDFVRSIPLLIVQGLVWADSVGFFFLARLSVAPAVRFLFLVGVEARRFAVGLLLGVALLDSLCLLFVLASVLPDGCCAWTAVCFVDFVASTVVTARVCCCPVHVFFHKSKFIRLESPPTLYERGDILAHANTVELKALPRL